MSDLIPEDVDNLPTECRDVPCANPGAKWSWVEGLKEFAAVLGFLIFVLCLIILGGME